MSTDNDNKTALPALPAPRGPPIGVSPASPPASSSPSTAAPVGSPALPQSAVKTSSLAVSQAEAFLATVTTPQRLTSPTNTTTVQTNVATAATTLTQSSTVRTNGSSPSHGPAVASPSTPLYNGIPLSLENAADLAKKYDDLMTDLSILRGEFDKDKPIGPIQIACKAEIKNRGFEQMRDHFDLGENINNLEREVKAREAAQKNNPTTDEMARNMQKEIIKYNDYDRQYEKKKEAITELRLALEHMGKQSGEQFYKYTLHSPFELIGNHPASLNPPRARRKSKMDTPKQDTPRQETPMLMEYTPAAETPLGQISPNKRKSGAASTPVAGFGEPDDDSRRRSGRVAKRAKADDFQDMNGTSFGTSSGKGKARAKGSMTGSVPFPNLSRNPKTSNANGTFTSVNTANAYMSANSSYATSPYSASYRAPASQTKEDWMLEHSAEMETVLSNLQIHKNDLTNLQIEQSTRLRNLTNLDMDIEERQGLIKTLEKAIRTKQELLDTQDKNIRNSDIRMAKAKDGYTSAVASMQGKLQQETDVDSRLAQKKREEKAADTRILELKAQQYTLEQEVMNLEQKKAALK